MGAEAEQDDRAARFDPRCTILEAARGRFLRFGPRKTTMDEVARAAGCSRTTLYSHFRNMEDLYGSLLEQDAEAFIHDASAAVENAAGCRGQDPRHGRDHPRHLRAEPGASHGVHR